MKKSVLILLTIIILPFYHTDLLSQTGSDTVQALLTPNGIFDQVQDNLGNNFYLSDLLLTSSKTIGGGTNTTNAAPTESCQAGYFTLFFAPGSIFTQGTQSVQSQGVVCELYNNLSGLIQSTIPNGAINIYFYDLPSGTSFNGLAYSYYVFPSTPINFNQGLIRSQLQKALITGIDPYANLPISSFIGSNNFYHASIGVKATAIWNMSMSTSTIASNEYSFYSAMLHEALHLLGFTSLIDISGGSKLPSNYFSPYDQFLYDYNGNPLIVSSTPSCPNSNLSFNTSTVSLSAISASGACTPSLNTTPNISTCSTAVQYSSSNVHVKVFTPDCWVSESSLSHLEDVCSTLTFTPSGPAGCTPTPSTQGFNDLYFVMSNSTSPGTCYIKNYPKEEERCILADLGYSLNTVSNTYTSNAYIDGSNTTYPYTSSCASNTQIVGINDGLNNGIYTFTTTGTSLTIPFTSLVANDTPSSAITPTCFEAIYSGVTLTNSSTHLTVTASQGAGFVLLKYNPMDGLGHYGNATYIFCYFLQAGCNAPTPCELVQNGGFESNQSSNTYSCGQFGGSQPIHVDCWESYFPNTPYLFGTTSCSNTVIYQLGVNTLNTSPPINTLSIPSNTNNYCAMVQFESPTYFNQSCVKNNLSSPLVNGQPYQFSMWVINHQATSTASLINPPNNPIVITVGAGPGPAFTTTLNFPSGVNTLTQFTVNPSNIWTHLTSTFVFNPVVPASALVIGINSSLTSSLTSGRYYCFIDEISLSPIGGQTFSIPTSTVCIGNGISDLALYTTTTGVFSGPGISLSGTQYDFNLTGTLSPGIYPIAFTYTNGTCLNTMYQNITIKSCCMQTFTGSLGNAAINSNTTYSTGTVMFAAAANCTVQPGVSLTLANDVVFGYNAKIIAMSGSSVIIENAHLHTCDNSMWQGIELQSGAFLSISNSGNGDNLIEDALIAVDASNQGSLAATINISNTTFNKNYIDIKLSDYASTVTHYPFNISKCVFTCRDFGSVVTHTAWPQTGTTSSLTNAYADLRYVNTSLTPTTGLASPYLNQSTFSITTLKNPYSNQPSHIAIQINSVGVTSGTTMSGPVIGSASNASDFNLFDAHGQFISVLNSHVTSQNNVFQNTQTYTVVSGSPTVVTTFSGTAISHSTSTLFNTQLQLGATSVDLGNRFWNCHRGISGKNIYRLWVENALFRSSQSSTNTSTPFAQGNTGIHLNTNRFEYYIGSNEFTNLENGINIALAPGSFTHTSTSFTVGLPGVYADRLRITNNVFTGSVSGVANTYMNDAINITSPLSIPWYAIVNNSVTPVVNAVAVNSNTINEVYRGVYLNGIRGFPSLANDNSVVLKDGGTSFGAQHGIKLVNCNVPILGGVYDKSIIASNEVSFSTQPLNTSTTSALIWCGHNGYSILTPSVTCNTLSQGSQGFVFEGPQPGTIWAGNSMDPLDAGLVLRNNGQIGTQGASSLAIANSWNGTWSGNHTYVDGLSFASNSQLYVSSAAVTNPTNNAGPNFQFSYQQGNVHVNSGGGDYSCGGIPNFKPISVPNNDDDHLSADYFYMDKLALYQLLLFNDSIKDSDDELTDFFSSLSESSMEQFMEVETLLYQGNPSSASDILDDIDQTELNTVELNYFSFYSLYASWLTEGSLTEAESIALYNLASLCPGTNGACIYQAAALYNAIYGRLINHSCDEDLGSRKASFDESTQGALKENNWNVDLFPNPAKDQITIRTPTKMEQLDILIKDLSGRTVMDTSVQVKEFITTLDIKLINGAYLIYIVNAKNETAIKKLLIAK